MKIVGCDLHTRYQQVAMLDTETGELIERRLEHANGEAKQFYSQLSGPVRVGIEATGHTRWFEAGGPGLRPRYHGSSLPRIPSLRVPRVSFSPRPGKVRCLIGRSWRSPCPSAPVRPHLPRHSQPTWKLAVASGSDERHTSPVMDRWTPGSRTPRDPGRYDASVTISTLATIPCQPNRASLHSTFA